MAGDHVDILGRSSLNDLILRVAGGKGELIEENYVSKIREYADKVKIYDGEDGGLAHKVHGLADKAKAEVREEWERVNKAREFVKSVTGHGRED